jgi:hypothetical protein
MATAAGTLADRGIEPPLLRSGNVDGGHEWNGRVFEEYADRIFYQPLATPRSAPQGRAVTEILRARRG